MCRDDSGIQELPGSIIQVVVLRALAVNLLPRRGKPAPRLLRGSRPRQYAPAEEALLRKKCWSKEASRPPPPGGASPGGSGPRRSAWGGGAGAPGCGRQVKGARGQVRRLRALREGARFAPRDRGEAGGGVSEGGSTFACPLGRLERALRPAQWATPVTGPVEKGTGPVK